MNPDIRYLIQKGDQVLQTPYYPIGSADTGILKNTLKPIGFFNDVWFSGPTDLSAMATVLSVANTVKTLYVWSVISSMLSEFKCVDGPTVIGVRNSLLSKLDATLNATSTPAYVFCTDGLLPLERQRFRVQVTEADPVEFRVIIETSPRCKRGDFFLTNVRKGPAKELLTALFMECGSNEELLKRLRLIDKRMTHTQWEPSSTVWRPYGLNLKEVPDLVDESVRRSFKDIDDKTFQQIRPLLLTATEQALRNFYKDTAE